MAEGGRDRQSAGSPPRCLFKVGGMLGKSRPFSLIATLALTIVSAPASMAADAPENATPESAAESQSDGWTILDTAELSTLADDDIARHRRVGENWDDIVVARKRFDENGFRWELLRLTSKLRPQGPLWVVLHDDEDAAFDSAIAALRLYGGVMVAVNSGPGAPRNQVGHGQCGRHNAVVTRCDPNRNFTDRAPAFSAAFLDARPAGQPIIAFHTNKPGFAGDGRGGSGHISLIGRPPSRGGRPPAIHNAYWGNGIAPLLDNPDSFLLMPFVAAGREPAMRDIACRRELNDAGINVWHEPVGLSDGSLSNLIALRYPGVTYFNIESREEPNLSVAADRHAVILAALHARCGDYFPPAAVPVAPSPESVTALPPG